VFYFYLRLAVAWAHKEERHFRHTKNRGRAGYSRATPHHICRDSIRAARTWERSHAQWSGADFAVRERNILRSDGAYWVTSLSIENVVPGAIGARWNGLYVKPTRIPPYEPEPERCGWGVNWASIHGPADRALLASLQARKQLKETTLKDAHTEARRRTRLHLAK